MSWRRYADWAKHKPFALRIADQLGRGRGRLRILDEFNPPPAAVLKPDLTGWEDRELAATWIGHASVLLRISGMTILTDPVMSHRVGVGLGLITGGPRRLTAAAIKARELPEIDLILLSHAHFDHLDRPTLVRLPKRTPIVTAHATRDLLTDLGFRIISELRWGESKTLGPLQITAHPVAHWGARTFSDHHRGYNAYTIASSTRRVLFGGDTAYHEGFREIAPVDLAILGIGAYSPYIQAHATPEQAWTMADHVRAKHILPMHHSTFRLSYEPTAEPMTRFQDAAGNDASRIAIREIGGMWTDDN